MKKVLAILVVLALVCGAVFADDLPNQGDKETHTVKIHTTVGLVNPMFQLEATSVTAKAADDTDVSLAQVVDTNVASNPNAKFEDGVSHDVATAIEAGDISKDDIVVTFDIKLLNAAKLVKSFDIKLEATGFEVNKDGVKQFTDVPAAVLAPKTITDNGVTAAEKVENSIFTASFTGKTCTAVTLADLELTYAKDEAVDPTSNKNDASYQSTVKMTVTAN